MSIPTAQSYPIARTGKPINVGDTVTILGTVSSVSGTGVAATINVATIGSNSAIVVQAQDVGASGQTL
jgi:predicted thioesterase